MTRTLTPTELAALRRINVLWLTAGWQERRRVINAEIRPTVRLEALVDMGLLYNGGEQLTKQGLKALAEHEKLERWEK